MSASSSPKLAKLSVINPSLGRLKSNSSTPHCDYTATLHVEYARESIEYGYLFRCSLFCEYSILEYEHVHVIYRVSQAECGIRIRVAAPQEYVNIDSTRRTATRAYP